MPGTASTVKDLETAARTMPRLASLVWGAKVSRVFDFEFRILCRGTGCSGFGVSGLFSGLSFLSGVGCIRALELVASSTSLALDSP